MKNVDDYLRVRRGVQIEGLSKRAAARRFGIDPRTVSKMMMFSVPQGYVRTKPPVRPKLDPFIAIIDKILTDDKSRPSKRSLAPPRRSSNTPRSGSLSGCATSTASLVASRS